MIIIELNDHPFMRATQFHPEFLSRPNRPHPLFLAFLDAVRKQAGVRMDRVNPFELVEEIVEQKNQE